MPDETMRSLSAPRGSRGIAAELRRRIESGGLPNGGFLPTERALQEEFGASRSTVRRALAMLIETGVAQNVPNRGVVAHVAPRRTVSPSTNTIALIDGSSYVLRVLLVRMSEQFRERGYHLVHLGGNNSLPMEESIMYAADQGFAGALVWPFRGFPDPMVLRESVQQLPIVALDHAIRGVRTDLATFDYLEASRLATAHLAEQGCKRIAVTGMLDMLEINHDRFSGYMKAVFESGAIPNAADYLFSYTSSMRAPDTRALERRLRDADRPDGIFVMQDQFVPDTIETALRCGLRVPEDLKIVTVGDDLDVDVDGVGMTTVTLDWDTMSFLAIEMLLDRIEQPDRPWRTRLAPHILTVRGLCGAPEREWTPAPDQFRGFQGNVPYPRSKFRFHSQRPDHGVQAPDHSTQRT